MKKNQLIGLAVLIGLLSAYQISAGDNNGDKKTDAQQAAEELKQLSDLVDKHPEFENDREIINDELASMRTRIKEVLGEILKNQKHVDSPGP